MTRDEARGRALVGGITMVWLMALGLIFPAVAFGLYTGYMLRESLDRKGPRW